MYFESILLYFESALLYFESILLYFKSILVYFAAMLASGCIEHQYSKGKDKVVINVYTLNMQTSLLLGIYGTTYAYFHFVRRSLDQMFNHYWWLGTFARFHDIERRIAWALEKELP